MKKEIVISKMMFVFVLVLVLGLVTLPVRGDGVETVIYEDDFSDGTHGFNGFGSFTIVDDTAGGLGTAALKWSGDPTAPCYENFTETTLKIGETLSLSYDIRFETTPQVLGMGLADDTDTDYGDWWKADYYGYTAKFSVTGGADKVFEYNVLQKPFEDIGTSTDFTTNAGWNDTAVHNFQMTITRTETGLEINVYWDGALLATRISSTPATYTYDTLGMRTDGGAIRPLLIDNVMVTLKERFAATNPLPLDGQGLAADPLDPLFNAVPVDAVLSWDAPTDPNFDSSYPLQYQVFMDPNETKVATGIGCVYSSSFSSNNFFDPAPDMAKKTQYYWRVDTKFQYDYRTDPNVLTGGVWTFKTVADNTAPVVDAGSNLLTWSANAALGIQLTKPTLLDNEGDATLLWTSDPNVIFTPNNTLHPTVKVINTTPTPGNPKIYTLTVTASDGVNPPSSDSMEIKVASDACDASKLNTQTPHVRLRGDYNNDCKENITDFAGFALEWLGDTSETANVWY